MIRLTLIIVLQLFLSTLPAQCEELDGHVSETESFPSAGQQNTTTPPSNNQLPSWFGIDNISNQAPVTLSVTSKSLPAWFGSPVMNHQETTVLLPPDQASEDEKPTNTGKQFSGAIQKQESSGNTSYTEIINDEHGRRVIDWNKWVDRFNRKFLSTTGHTPSYQFWFRSQSNAEADFTFTISQYGSIDFSPGYCNNQLLQGCAEQAISQMRYAKYLKFPEGSQRSKFTFESGIIAHRGSFPHAYGYQEQVNY